MSDLDFDEIARLWREPDPSEQEAVAMLVGRVKRQARLLGLADVATGLLLILTTLFGIFLEPGVGTGSAGAALIAATLWLNWKRRSIRQMARSLRTRDRSDFLEAALRHARSNVRRASLTLALFPCFVMLAILFKLAFRNGGRLDHPVDAVAAWAASMRGLLVIPVVLVMTGLLTLALRRYRRECRKTEALLDEYRKESEADEHYSDMDDSL